jgi:hypothetical protein
MDNKSIPQQVTVELFAVRQIRSSQNIVTHQELESVLQLCFNRLRLWTAPLNWSERDWHQELTQLIAIAASEALKCWLVFSSYFAVFYCWRSWFRFGRF